MAFAIPEKSQQQIKETFESAYNRHVEIIITPCSAWLMHVEIYQEHNKKLTKQNPTSQVLTTVSQ